MEKEFATLVRLLPALVGDRVIESNNQLFAIMEGIALGLGADWPAERQRLMAEPARWAFTKLEADLRGEGHLSEVECLSLAQVVEWLRALDPVAVRPDLWGWLDFFQSGTAPGAPQSDPDTDLTGGSDDDPPPSNPETFEDVIIAWLTDHHEVIAGLREQHSQLARRVEALERRSVTAPCDLRPKKRVRKGKRLESVQ